MPRHALANPSNNIIALESPPHKPATPLPAKIWVIRQDATLHLSDVSVIAYQPHHGRYLVSGINPDNLIVSANLPNHAHGKHTTIN